MATSNGLAFELSSTTNGEIIKIDRLIKGL